MELRNARNFSVAWSSEASSDHVYTYLQMNAPPQTTNKRYLPNLISSRRISRYAVAKNQTSAASWGGVRMEIHGTDLSPALRFSFKPSLRCFIFSTSVSRFFRHPWHASTSFPSSSWKPARSLMPINVDSCTHNLSQTQSLAPLVVVGPSNGS